MSGLGSPLPDSLAVTAAQRVDPACNRFEAAWKSGQRPIIRDYLGLDGTDRPALLFELVQLDLDYRWRAGEHRLIEAYVAEWPELNFDGQRLLELATHECQIRVKHGQRPSINEYRSRFTALDSAKLAAHIRPLLEVTEGMDESANDDDTIAQLDRNSSSASRISPAPAQQPLPTFIGRYRVARWLGSGGFGDVYLAHDEQLDCPMAIKVPRDDRLASEHATAAFLSEARHVARLRHPRIVRVYNFGEADGRCYLVYEYIEGVNLAQRLAQRSLEPTESALLIAEIADALHYAHGRRSEYGTGLYHRDIKPSNILLDEEGRPHLTDFGLAVWEEEVPDEQGHRFGTDAYMSPEQVRREGHRIDGRSDIYSLGVVLYELLCRRRPFAGKTKQQLYDHILNTEPRPPRQTNAAIPAELERICLKALAKQISERYTTAVDMANELRRAVKAALPPPPPAAPLPQPVPPRTPDPVPTLPPARVMPKGLRAFGREDSDFFLHLLPGPRDRNGLPESIRFWKTRIESSDPDRQFAVGVIYGPSGCGKSSLVRAGLLPQLAPSVATLYVEATRDDTEFRLVTSLRRTCPALEDRNRLADLMTAIGRGRGLAEGKKLLIVLDQFEQWLYGHGQEMESSELVFALRQADGEHLQVLLLVRDDFWMGISRLFEHLYINLDPDRNTRAGDLFDLKHARRVLHLFGHALDRLPVRETELTKNQNDFLDQAVHEMSQDGRVIPAQVSLFADLMKTEPWTLASLLEKGGVSGLLLRFLEETFSARSPILELRTFKEKPRALLAALLPDSGPDIKGRMLSRQQLATPCDLAADSDGFARLIHILDHELHLITPVETEQGGFYQLTHDYLITSVQQWLDTERRKKWRGRAELCLEERTRQMTRWPQSRYRPSLFEYLQIVLAVPRSRLRPEQRALMRQAARYHALWSGIVLGAIFLVGLLAWRYTASIQRSSTERQADAQMGVVLGTAPSDVPSAIEKLSPFRRAAIVPLRTRFKNRSNDLDGMRAAFALAAFGESDESVRKCLIEAIAQAAGPECKNIVAALQPAETPIRAALIERASDESASIDRRLRYLTVLLHLGDPAGERQLATTTANPEFRAKFIHGFGGWHGDLTHMAETLRNATPPLRSALCSALGYVELDSLSAGEQGALKNALSSIYVDDPDGGTHSAAAWALRRWKLDLPRVARPSDSTGRDWFVNGRGMTMLRIRDGSFLRRDPDHPDANAQKLTLKRAYFMCDREVWVDLFREFMNDPAYDDAEKPKSWQGTNTTVSPAGDYPVQQVSWFDAVLFCNWLSWKEGRKLCYTRTGAKKKVIDAGKEVEWEEWACDFDAVGYRLPTEAEWEFACRAGANTEYSFGDDDSMLPNYAVFAASRAARTADRLPNLWGLFDMHGNVAEWCYDLYGDYPEGSQTDPTGPTTGDFRLGRGGSWTDFRWFCRCGHRNAYWPTSGESLVGFRPVCGATVR